MVCSKGWGKVYIRFRCGQLFLSVRKLFPDIMTEIQSPAWLRGIRGVVVVAENLYQIIKILARKSNGGEVKITWHQRSLEVIDIRWAGGAARTAAGARRRLSRKFLFDLCIEY